MANEKTNQRVIASRRVIVGWERAAPAGKPEDLLRMIGEEIATLRQVIADHPDRALTVGDLVKRYLALAELVKRSAN